MYVKQCSSALACALTLGLATGGYAQTVTARSASHHAPSAIARSVVKPTETSDTRTPVTARAMTLAPVVNPNGVRPYLLTPGQAFNTTFPAYVVGTNLGSHRPASRAISTLYMNFPAPANIGNNQFLFRFGPQTAPNTTSALLDDFDLSFGATGTSGAPVSDFTFLARNNSAADAAPGATQDAYAVVKFYDSFTQNTGPAPITTTPVLAEFDVKIAAMGPTERRYVKVTVPSTNPLVLHDDLSNQTGIGSGFEVRFYDDLAHTMPSAHITAQFALNTTANGGVQVGFSDDFIEADFANTGAFPSNAGFFFGGYPNLANLVLQINGTPQNPIRYNISGHVTFPNSSTDGPVNVVWQIHPHTAGAGDIVISGVINTTGVADPVTGILGPPETGSYTLTGFLPDTYDVDIIAEGSADVNIPNVAVTNQNAYFVDATFNNPGSDVAGGVALEGVADLSTTNPAAPLGVFTLSFRTPGTTTELFHRYTTLTTTAGSATGTYNVFGVPDGTYDVRIKGNKNLAVLKPGVVVSGAGTVPNVLLNGGDTNNDNQVDPTDFGLFVSAYNSSAAAVGSGYDPAADFNYDGAVDPTDFNIFVGDYNTAGAP